MDLKDSLNAMIMKILVMKTIIHIVAEDYNCTIEELVSRSKEPKISEARSVVWYLCRKFTDYSCNDIDGLFNRDHTTIIMYTRKMSEKYQQDDTFRSQIDALMEKIHLPWKKERSSHEISDRKEKRNPYRQTGFETIKR